MTAAGEPRLAWDFVVVGGGGCGLAGAIAAAERGARVLLIEKSSSLGGNTARSVGSVPGAGTRFQEFAAIEDSGERFFEDLRARAGGRGDASPVRRMCDISAGLVHWLVDEVGADLRLTTDYKHVAHSVNRLHNPPSREGAELIAALERRARSLGVAIELNTPALDVRAATASAEVKLGHDENDWVSTGAVLLAANGFGGADELVAEYCGLAGRLAYFGAPSNTGDGLRLGLGLGARLANMNSYLGYAVMAIPPKTPANFETLFSWTIPEIGGIAITTEGRRFGNEDEGYSAFSDTVLEAAGGRCNVVFDERMLAYVSTYEPRFRRLVERDDSPVVGASDATELAALIDADPALLEDAVTTYGLAARGEVADPFGRQTFGMAPLTGRLYACPTEPGILTTQGGLVVDDHARVLSADGNAIPRVYAGGSTAAGISGDQGAKGYASGNGLLTALGYGFLAGRHVAQRTGAAV